MRKVYLLTVLAVIALLGWLAASPALAANGFYYTVTAPADVTFANLLAEGADSGNKELSVATDDTGMSTVKVEVRDSTGHGGRLTSGGTSLSTALTLDGAGLTPITPLSNSNQTLITAGTLEGSPSPKTWSVIDLVITQPPFDAVPSGSYTLTITFTVTFSP